VRVGVQPTVYETPPAEVAWADTALESETAFKVEKCLHAAWATQREDFFICAVTEDKDIRRRLGREMFSAS